jgi:hypothetical protein
MKVGTTRNREGLRRIKGSKDDGLVKSLKRLFSVIPAQAGIQSFQIVGIPLDSRSPIKNFEDKFHGNDDSSRIHQRLIEEDS